MSFVKGGLQDLSISRTTFDWGVKVPGNPEHVMYVWVDALTNYITAVGYPDTESAKFRRYWPADLHVIGKDIVRFHAVYWPAFLMSAGIDVPRRIFSHGFLFNRGEKMSKSVGNVIDPFALADAYGVDPLRYFLLREVPFGQDGNYSHEAIVNRINADLSNDLGNLAQRSLTMIGKQLGGVMPKPGDFSANDQTILAATDAMIGKAREAMKTQQLHQVLNAVWAVVADANRYFAGEAPWALAKTDPARQGTVLYVTAEVIRQVAILAQPFVPASAAKLLDLLGVPAEERDFTWAGGGHRLAFGVTLPRTVNTGPAMDLATVTWRSVCGSVKSFRSIARITSWMTAVCSLARRGVRSSVASCRKPTAARALDVAARACSSTLFLTAIAPSRSGAGEISGA